MFSLFDRMETEKKNVIVFNVLLTNIYQMNIFVSHQQNFQYNYGNTI